MNSLQKQLLSFDEERLQRLYMAVFNTNDGQLIFQDLKNRAFFHVPFVVDQDRVDPYKIAWRDGMRSVILHIETMLEPIELKVQEQGKDNENG